MYIYIYIYVYDIYKSSIVNWGFWDILFLKHRKKHQKL